MVARGAIGRRALLAGLAACVAVPAGAAQPRLAAIDWAMLETAMALGVVPIAACELRRFRTRAVTPEVPPSVVDLGLRGATNFELLQLTRPDLILSSPFYLTIEHRLGGVAPVLSLPFYTDGEAPWPKSLNALHRLAARLEMPRAAEIAEDRALETLETHARQLAPMRERPVYVVQIGDARHVRVFGPDSMFGDVLTRLGLQNAWDRETRFSFSAPVPIERLAAQPEARIVVVSEVPVLARRGLAQSVVWNRLPPVAEGRLSMIGEVNPFGGVPAGLRFARLLRDALLRPR